MTGLADFLDRHAAVAEVRLSRVRGSSPREAGARMYVAANATLGTIGGGQLEYMAIDTGRAMLARGEDHASMDVPLGPEIGQCCGGRVGIALTRMSRADKARAIGEAEAERAALPQVHIFGAGHVGRALERALRPLPVRPVLIDSRAEELALAEGATDPRLTPLPEAELRHASLGDAVVILTHDHALDFMIAAEALARDDLAYVGMIGSKTKRASFTAWLRREGSAVSPTALVCPIGGGATKDKRPDVIAVLVAAEIIVRLTTEEPIRDNHTDREKPARKNHEGNVR